MASNLLFQRLQWIPDGAEEIPGVWPDKRGPGCRVPTNALSVLDMKPPVLNGSSSLSELLQAPGLPEWLDGFLLPHQRRALEKALTRPSFNVWAPPGSGKTLVGLVWLAADPGIKVVVTKAGARGTWREEIRKYTTLQPVLLTGKQSKLPPPPYTNTVFITAWETIIDWSPVLAKMGIGSIVFDEIHWAKSPKRVKRLLQSDGSIEWRPLNNAAAAAKTVSDSSDRRLGMTATPIPNRPRDLWAQLDLIEPWQWGTHHTFGVRYCDGFKDTYGWKYDGLSNKDELLERLVWSKHKTSSQAVNANLPAKRRQIVKLSVEEQDRPAGGFKRDIQRAAKTGDHEALFEVLLQEAASRKRKYVVDRVLDATSSGQKVVVFTGRRKDCDRLGEAIRKKLPESVPVWCAHGGTTTDKRDVIRREYMEADVGILVGTGDAWGESVNLQDTDLALIVMLPWTPRAIAQWEGRFSRLGQKRPVLVSYVIAQTTVDEHVADVLLDKLPAVAEVSDDPIAAEVEEAFATTSEDLLKRVAASVSY